MNLIMNSQKEPISIIIKLMNTLIMKIRVAMTPCANLGRHLSWVQKLKNYIDEKQILFIVEVIILLKISY